MWRYCLVLTAACGRIGFADIDASDAGNGDGGGDGGDGGGSAARCSGASLLADDFSATTVSLARWGQTYEDVPGMYALTGGRARLTLQANASTPTYSAIETARAYDLTDDALVVEIATTPSSATGTEMMFVAFGFASGTSYSIKLTISSGLTRMWLTGAGISELASAPHDPVAHRFLRLREQGGTVYGDVSSDGQNWNPLGQTAVPWNPAYTQFSLMGGTYQAVASPGIAEWESVNAGVSPAGGFCPIDGVTGNFSDGMLAPEWTKRFGPSTCTETGGKLSLSLPASMTSSCELMSRRGYDLTGRSVVGDISTTTAAVNTQTYFGIARDPNNNAMISDWGGFMAFEVYVNGLLMHQTPSGQRPAYNATNHRRWRIRHDATSGALIAELGTASGTYVELGRYTGAFETNGVYLWFAGDNNNAAVSSLGELSAINP